MEVLLALRGWRYAKCPPKDCPKSVERVCLVVVNGFHRLILYSTARIFLGRGAVMAKGLGTTVEEEHRNGLHKLAKVCLMSYVSVSD